MQDDETDARNATGEETNSTDSLFDKTNAATARLEEANKKQEELLNRQEDLYAKQKLGGQSMAGQAPAEPTKLSDEDYADKLMKGEVDPLGEDGISINP